MSHCFVLPAFCQKIKPQAFGLCMVLLMAMACGFTGSTAETPGEFSDFASFIEQKMESDCIPGVAAAIVRGDELVFAQGFGMRDMEAELPVTPEMRHFFILPRLINL